MSRKYRELVADFETTPDPADCRVWAWAIANVSDNPVTTYGTELDDFLTDISRFDSKIWFHNLKFDAAFIIDELLRRGYTWMHDNTFLRAREFTGLISNMGEHYQITVQWGTGHRTIFQDSYKKITMSVANVAEAFQLPEAKGELDHTKVRPAGYVPTDDEWDYVRRDVEIMAQAMHQRLQDGKKLTIGSDALNDFKTVFGRGLFEKMFPVLNPETDNVIRAAYRGGYTYVNPKYQGVRTGPGSVYDVNSMYPYVMIDKPLPYGFPTVFDDYPPDNGLYIVSITFTARLRDGFLPMLQIKNNFLFSPTAYLESVDEPTTLVVTNVDLELMHEHYHLNILSYNGGYTFKQATGVFAEYIDKWSTIKETTTGGRREIAKLFLNSLYGKFATNPDITGKYPVLDEETNTVRLKVGPEETRDPVYTAMGVFITSWARDTMIRAAQKHVDRFIYCDTDSLHMTGTHEPEGLVLHETQLGAWDHEYNFVDGVFLKAKQYAEEKFDGSTVVKIAGAPENITRTLALDDMVVGNTFHGKLQVQRVPGGIVLHETTFTIT